MNLGEFTEALEAQPQDNIISFGFGGLIPGTFHSYRGYYEELAIDFVCETNMGEQITVATLLSRCEEANGKVFTGYKGGDFRMDKNTSVYVSEYDSCSGTMITEITDLGYGYSIIHTEYTDN